MNTAHRIGNNILVLFVAKMASYLFSFLYMAYTASYLGPASFGILSFALAFTEIFAVWGDFGLRPFIVREVARDKSLVPKYLANISLMKIILAAIAFGLIAVTINIMGDPQETIKVVYLLGIFVIFQAFAQMLYSIFQALEHMEYEGIGQMLNGASLLAGVILAVKYSFNVVGFASLYVMASVIVLSYSFAVMKLRFSNPVASAIKAIEFDWSFWKPTIRGALPFFILAIFDVITMRIGMVMLSVMKGDAVVGWFNAASRSMEIFLVIPMVFTASIYPVVSRFYISSQKSLELAYQLSFKYLSILGLPVAVGIALLADRVILIIFGSEYVQSITALRIIIWVLPITFLTYITGTILQSINRQWVFTKVVLLCMVSNIAMNLVLIPRYSYIGAAVATIITGLIGFLYSFHFVSKLVCKIQVHKLIIKPVIASGVMGLFVVLSHGLPLPLLIPVAAITYFGILIVLKTFSRVDLDLFRQIVILKPRAKVPHY